MSDESCRFLRPQARRINDRDLNSSLSSAIDLLWDHDLSLPWACFLRGGQSEKMTLRVLLSAPRGYVVQIFGLNSQKQKVLTNKFFFFE